ncbi:hypothetical protein ACIRBY_37245 [Streptomyces sp. NPDC096136]|uniref:hypothetical protein n=1 Tax=Streptomyces sp. NPDC096136 TaxID=3366076 RepID=UPI00382176DA
MPHATLTRPTAPTHITDPLPQACTTDAPAPCTRCTGGCHHCYWTGTHGATEADYDPTRWRATYAAETIGPKLSWTARHLEAVDHAATTGIVTDPQGGYRRRPGGRRIAAALVAELTASGFLTAPDEHGRIEASPDGRKASLLLHTADPVALLSTADQAARARRIYRKHQGDTADYKQQLTFPCLPDGDHAQARAARARERGREFARQAAISRAEAEERRQRAEAEYAAEQAADRDRRHAERERAVAHAMFGCGECPDTWTVDARCGICRTAAHPAPYRPEPEHHDQPGQQDQPQQPERQEQAQEEPPAGLNGPELPAAPTPAKPAPAPAPDTFAQRPMGAIEGLPPSVSITPLTLRDDAYAVQCMPCGGGGAYTTVQTIRDGNWSRNSAYAAAQAHAQEHARQIETALNTPTWERQARALGWSTAQADAVCAAARGHLHYDGTVFYQMDPTDPRARGRTVSRRRIAGLTDAGFLVCDGRYVTPTEDGTAALRAWSRIRPQPATTERTCLRPLPGGQEEARRAAHDRRFAERLREIRLSHHEQLELWPREPVTTPPRRPRRARRPPIATRFPGQTHVTLPATLLPLDPPQLRAAVHPRAAAHAPAA